MDIQFVYLENTKEYLKTRLTRVCGFQMEKEFENLCSGFCRQGTTAVFEEKHLEQRREDGELKTPSIGMVKTRGYEPLHH